jgi:hypothetical protein
MKIAHVIKTSATIISMCVSMFANAEKHNVKEYGIAIIPDDTCYAIAGKLNQDISGYANTMPNLQNTWHITLFQGAFITEDLQYIQKEIDKLKDYKIDVILYGMVSKSNRWIDLNIKNEPKLVKLHEKTVQLLSKYTKRKLDRVNDIYHDLEPDMQRQSDQFGVYGILGYYRPHLTLFYSENADSKIYDIYEKYYKNYNDKIRCEIKNIVIGELGYAGNITKVIYTKDLK